MALNTKQEIAVSDLTLDGKHLSYNFCRVCGYSPQTDSDEPNYGPFHWWDADDGWKIGTLCRGCWEDVKDDEPQPDDFAYDETNGICDDEFTDDDPLLALM